MGAKPGRASPGLRGTQPAPSDAELGRARAALAGVRRRRRWRRRQLGTTVEQTQTSWFKSLHPLFYSAGDETCGAMRAIQPVHCQHNVETCSTAGRNRTAGPAHGQRRSRQGRDRCGPQRKRRPAACPALCELRLARVETASDDWKPSWRVLVCRRDIRARRAQRAAALENAGAGTPSAYLPQLKRVLCQISLWARAADRQERGGELQTRETSVPRPVRSSPRSKHSLRLDRRQGPHISTGHAAQRSAARRPAAPAARVGSGTEDQGLQQRGGGPS